MSGIKAELERLMLDELGRVVLSDSMLEKIEYCPATTSAGANLVCPGVNTSCTNQLCAASKNGQCTNVGQCLGATNNLCGSLPEVPGN